MTVAINLLPWREARREERNKQFIYALSLVVMVALFILIVTHLFHSSEINHQERRNRMITAELTKLDAKLVEIQDLKKKRDMLLARMQIIQELQSRRPGVVRLFDALPRVVPDGLTLQKISRVGDNLTIEGYAESNSRVSEFMRTIEKTRILSKPKLSVIQAEDQAIGNIRFYLTAVVGGTDEP